MKTLVLSFLLGVLCINQSQATDFFCENKGNNQTGSAQLKGSIDDLNGKVMVSGEAFYSSISRKEEITFFRNQRENEEQFSYARYTGGGLFHLFFFSIPKKFLSGEQSKFTGYLRYLREGVGDITEIVLKCGAQKENALMKTLISRYTNLITYERVQDEGDDDKVFPIRYKELPKSVLKTLNKLEMNISNDWDFESTFPDSPYVVNFSPKATENDAMVVRDNSGKVAGYIFNVTTCNIEECYGWDALYLDQSGYILHQSF